MMPKTKVDIFVQTCPERAKPPNICSFIVCVLSLHLVESNEGDECPNVGLGERGAGEEPLLSKDGFHAVQRLEQLGDCFVVGRLGFRKAALVYAVVHLVVNPLVHLAPNFVQTEKVIAGFIF